MRKQKLILPIAIILAMTFVTLASAAIASTIGSGGIIVGGNYSSTNFLINCTTAADADDCENCLNATIMYAPDGGDAVNGTTLCTIINDTDGDVTFLSSENTACATAWAALTEGDNTPGINVTCSFYNVSETAAFPVINATNSIWTVGVDNTAPTCSVSIAETSVSLGRYFKYTIAITDAATGLQPESTYVYCNITDAEGEVDKDGVISTSASSTEFTNTHVAGTYNISCLTTDYASNTASCSDLVTAKTQGSPIDLDVDKGISFIQGLDKNTMIIAIVVILLIAVAMNSKKK